jgi:hypothetical protein
MVGAIKWLRITGEAIQGIGIYGALFHWLARFDTPADWARVQAEQANAAAHGEFMCIYDPLPLLHNPAINSFLTRAATLWWAAVLLAVSFALSVGPQLWALRRGYDDEVAVSEREMVLVAFAISLAMVVPFTL